MLKKYTVHIEGTTYPYRGELSLHGFFYRKDKGFFLEGALKEDAAWALTRFMDDKRITVHVIDSQGKELDDFGEVEKVVDVGFQVNGEDIRVGSVALSQKMLFKQVRKENFVYKYNGYPIDKEVYQTLLKDGFKKVRYYNIEESIAYITRLDFFGKFAHVIYDPYGREQYVLPMNFWWSECTSCPLYDVASGPQVSTSGPRDADVMIIGEAPGADEVEQGVPFVGRSGQLLSAVLEDVGIDRDKCYITNTVACFPPPDANGSIKPTAKAINCCKWRVTQDLFEIRPKLIVTLGSTPTEALIGNPQKKTMTYMQEGRRAYKVAGLIESIVFPMFHPSYVLRNPTWYEGSPKWQMRERARVLRSLCDEMKLNATNGLVQTG